MLTATAMLGVLLAGLTAGCLAFGVLAVTPVSPALPSAAFVLFYRAMVTKADPLMPILSLAAALVGLGTLVPLLSDDDVVQATATGVGLVALVVHVFVTLRLNRPINLALAEWDPRNPPLEWQRVRDRWNRYHALRAAAVLVAFVGYLVSAVGTV